MSDSKTIDVVHIGKLHVPSDRDYVLDIVSDASATSTGILQTPQGHTIDSTASGLEVAGALIVPDGIEADIDGDVEGTLSGQWYLDKGTYDPEAPDTDDLYAYVSPTGEIGAAQIRIGELLNSAPTAEINEDGDAHMHSLVVGTTGSEEVTIDATGITAPEFRGDLVRTTAEARPCVLVPLTDWAQSTTGPGCALAAEKTDAKLMAQVTEPANRTVTGWSLAGSYTEAAGVSGTARLYKRVGGVDTAIDAAVTLTENAGALSASQTLATPEVLAAGASYYVLVTVTTGAGDAAGVESVFVSAK